MSVGSILCGKVFTAEPPSAAVDRKYDATAATMIGLLKYGTGMPFNRLSGLQRNVGILLPPSAQWDIVNELAREVAAAYEELIRQAAQADVVFNDDTSVKILEMMPPEARRQVLAEDGEETSDRTDLFTSGVVTTCEQRQITLFFSGHKHAGENLEDVRDRCIRRIFVPGGAPW
jgi:transposase